jgi:hypothetical protein
MSQFLMCERLSRVGRMLRTTSRRMLIGFFFVLAAIVPASAVRIVIPHTVDTTHLSILEGVYGRGKIFDEIDTRRAVYEYATRDAGSNMLLMLAPGFKAVMVGEPSQQLPDPVTPVFEPAPMVPVNILLTYSDGSPIADTRVTIGLFLSANEFFGYPYPIGYQAGVTTGTTDSKGRMKLNLPSLLDDPYFAKYDRIGQTFHFVLPDMWRNKTLWQLSPGRLEARRSYPETVKIRLVYNATIIGTIQRSFWVRNGVDVPMGASETHVGNGYRVTLTTSGNGFRSGGGVAEDGRFSIHLSPGAYDLSVYVYDADNASVIKRIPIPGRVVLKEGDYRIISLE